MLFQIEKVSYLAVEINYMRIIILVIVLMFMSLVFAFSAKTLLRYYRKLSRSKNKFYLDYQEEHSKWYSYLRFSLPIIIAGFCFNTMAALIGAAYVTVRWLSNL